MWEKRIDNYLAVLSYGIGIVISNQLGFLEILFNSYSKTFVTCQIAKRNLFFQGFSPSYLKSLRIILIAFISPGL
jgi:hypothetical protein